MDLTQYIATTGNKNKESQIKLAKETAEKLGIRYNPRGNASLDVLREQSGAQNILVARSGQLLLETPRTLLICTVFLLVGWLSWNGLEDMARLTVLCVVLVGAILLLALAGSVELFSVENLLTL